MGQLTEFLIDLSSIVAALAICYLVGIAILAAVGPVGLRYPAIVAPVLGFGWICVAATNLYYLGISPSYVFIFSLFGGDLRFHLDMREA